MTEKNAKEVLKENHFFLVHNIIPTSAFWAELSKEKLLPETMLKEVQAVKDVKAQNEKLLELLSVRGPAVIMKLCDVLQLTNHNYLAQFLREQLSDDGHTNPDVDADLLLKRYPRLEKQLDKQDRKELAKIIQEKAREITLKKEWGGDTADKQRAIEATRKQLEEHWRVSDMLKEKDALIKQMGEQMDIVIHDAELKGVSLKHVTAYMDEMKRKHKKDMEIQMKYNAANDNSIRRQQEQQADLNHTLTDMNNDIIRHMKLDKNIRPSSTGSEDNFKLITPADYAKHNLSRLLDRYEELMKTEKKYEQLSDEAFYVLTHTGRDVKTNLRDAFQGYVVENEEAATKLRDEIAVLRANSERDKSNNREQSEQEHGMIQELEHVLQRVRAESKAKDEKVKCLRQDIQRLEKEITKLRQRGGHGGHGGHSHFHDATEGGFISPHRDLDDIIKPRDNIFRNSNQPIIHAGPYINTHHSLPDTVPGTIHVARHSSEYHQLHRNGFPAIKNLSKPNPHGTIHYHNPQELLALSREQNKSPQTFRGTKPLGLSPDSMVINQLGMPKKAGHTQSKRPSYR